MHSALADVMTGRARRPGSHNPPCSQHPPPYVRPLLVKSTTTSKAVSAHAGSNVGTAALACLAPLVALPAGEDLNAPWCIVRTELALSSPNTLVSLSRLLVVSFASCGSSPMQDACLSCHRSPSCAIPVRQRGSFIMTPCPRQCLATYFIPPLAQPSCVPVPPPPSPFATHSSTVVLLRPSSLRPFTTHRPAVSPSPSLPQQTQVAQPQPLRLIAHPCVTRLPLTRHLRVTATIDLDLTRRPSRKTLLVLSRW